MSVSLSTTIAVIGFSNLASPLLPLWPTTHRAMLPIAGKPLIVHHIENLAEAGVRHIRIAGSVQQFPIRRRIGDGSEWGVTVRYSDLHGPDLRDECIAASRECLYLLGDQIPVAGLKDVPHRRTHAVIPDPVESEQAGIYSIQADGVVGYKLDADESAACRHRKLANVADVLTLNAQAARGDIDSIILPGASIHECAVADWNSVVSASAYIGRGVVVGKHCNVMHSARLEKNVVLSNGTFVDAGACLENVLVLPNTYVSSSLRLRDSIVGHDGILDLDGQFYPAEVHGMVGQTRRFREQKTGLPGRLPSPWRKRAARTF